MKVVVVGCGLGGLACAISCLQEGLDVEMLEKASQIDEIGAGIQMPPNATRVMTHFGIDQRFIDYGAIRLDDYQMLRYFDGAIIAQRPRGSYWEEQFGRHFYSVHRADYQRILFDRATELGAKIRTSCNIVEVDFESPCVLLDTGEKFQADVVIGADGLRSFMRNKLLGYDHEGPVETGDMAYRIAIPRGRIEELNDPWLLSFMDKPALRMWVGPDSHVVMYPLRNKSQYNLVLLRPDDLPSDVPTAIAEAREMREAIKGWDPVLNRIISCVDSVLKWKIKHMSELSTWTKGSVALLGDACHPSLPYQAQGAAMAVEDGATIGILLGLLKKSPLINAADCLSHIPEILKLYENMRKNRTTLNVKGSAENRQLFHLHDGPEAEARNIELRSINWYDNDNNCKWLYGNAKHQKDLMGFDAVEEARRCFKLWIEEQFRPMDD